MQKHSRLGINAGQGVGWPSLTIRRVNNTAPNLETTEDRVARARTKVVMGLNRRPLLYHVLLQFATGRSGNETHTSGTKRCGYSVDEMKAMTISTPDPD
jgi:hypothetical protein